MQRALTAARGVVTTLREPVRVGYVHSVFRHAANLWLPPDTLLAIADPAAVRVPNGVVVAAPTGSPDEAFLGLGVTMTVWVGAGYIRIPAAGIGIDAVAVPVWNPRPQFLAQPVAPSVLGNRLDRLAWLIREQARRQRWSFASVLDPTAPHELGACDEGLAALVRRARPAARELLSGIEACETGAIASAARGLAGLGHGLTPSGDDFLIGICGALALAEAALPLEAARREAGHRQEQAAAIAAAAAGRTTVLSTVWLDHAARGEFSAEVGDVLVSLAAARADRLAGAVARLLAVGASSGLDTAMGVLLGGRAVLSTKCRDRLTSHGDPPKMPVHSRQRTAQR